MERTIYFDISGYMDYYATSVCWRKAEPLVIHISQSVLMLMHLYISAKLFDIWQLYSFADSLVDRRQYLL